MANLATESRQRTASFLHKVLNVISHARISFTRAKMSQTMGPELVSTPSITPYTRSALSLQRASTSSLQSSGDDGSLGTSSVSIPFEDGDVDVVRVEGLHHANLRLDARHYKSASFAEQLLHVIHALRTPSWSNTAIVPEAIQIQKVSGSLTNAVFFISCPSIPGTRILLLRIYGPSSGSLISRPRELHTLHVLSSQYRIGPRVYGTFENGRVEEYFESTTLTASDMRDPKISSWIGARMAELHGVDVNAVEPIAADGGESYSRELAVKRNVRSWLGLARDVLALPSAPEDVCRNLNLDAFEREWDQYIRWLAEEERRIGTSPRVFGHNDAQYGNLLRLKSMKRGAPEHCQLIVVDFEYASTNAAAYDIANHFHEWTFNYHTDTPHVLHPERYPTLDERRNFYRAYLSHYSPPLSDIRTPNAPLHEPLEADLDRLEKQVRAWSPASHAIWAVWGVVQARETVEGKDGEPEFDYLGYAQHRMEGFRRELRALQL